MFYFSILNRYIRLYLLFSLFCFYIEAQTNENDYSNVEQKVLLADQINLANLMQELRLSNPYPKKSLHWSVWNEEDQLNVPILVLSSLALDSTCQRMNKTSLLFSARGCCHFIKIFRTLFPEYQSHYLHSSRYVYRHPTPEYVNYFKSLYSPNSLIVDELGSGCSCKEFFQRFFPSQPHYIALVGVGKNIDRIVHGSSNRNLENINFDLVGSLISYDSNGPIRVPPEYNIEDVQPAHDCINKCVQLLKYYRCDKFDKNLLKKLFTELQNHRPALKSYFINSHKPASKKACYP